jgi:hypothetical protein
LERWHQGILTVPSMIEVLAVCKRRGTCCRLPYSFVILSAARELLCFCHPDRSAPSMPCASVEERPFRAASERLSEWGFSPGDKQSLGFLRGPSPLIICHPEGRAKKVAPERESKDLCTLAFQRWHQGILTVSSMIELICPAPMLRTLHKSYRIAAAYPYLFVILSAAKHSRLALFRCHPERTRGRAAVQSPRKRFPLCERAAFVEERPFRAASERLSERGFSPRDKKSLGFLRGPSPLIILSS